MLVSGKTCVVVNRIAKLMNMGICSSEILAVTFTNKAAKEMKDRLMAQDLAPPLSLTFHALGVRILRESIHHFGYSNDFQVYDVGDCESLLRDIIFQKTGRKEKKFVREIRGMISVAKTNLLKFDGGDFSMMSFSSQEEKRLFEEVYRRYCEEMKGLNAVDFDDLIMLTVFILER